MKYVKLYENIDWNNWDDEEKDNNINLEEYIIKYDNLKQCIDIAKKLNKMGYPVYNYDELLNSKYIGYSNFIFYENIWCRSSVNIRKILSYDDFMNF
jgi:hypothetical protein